MENETRLVKAVSYLDDALRRLTTVPLNEFQIKTARTSIRNAMTLIRNTKSDFRFLDIEKRLALLEHYIIENKSEKPRKPIREFI